MLGLRGNPWLHHLFIYKVSHTFIKSPLTKKKVKPKGSAVSDHLLLWNHTPFFLKFSILTKDDKKILIRIESLLIIIDKPSLNRNITSVPL